MPLPWPARRAAAERRGQAHRVPSSHGSRRGGRSKRTGGGRRPEWCAAGRRGQVVLLRLPDGRDVEDELDFVADDHVPAAQRLVELHAVVAAGWPVISRPTRSLPQGSTSVPWTSAWRTISLVTP